jgi:peroxiredoxin Q/BCP
MRMTRNVALPLAVCLLGAAAAALMPPAARAADTPPAVGSMAPDFTLSSQEGTPTSLSSFRGKWVVLYFYPKDFTSGCTIEAHGFQRDMAQYEKKNAVIVGVSVDSVGSHKDFCAKEGLSFKLLSDEQKKVVALYGSARQMGDNTVAQRNTFLIDPQGTVQKVFLAVNPSQHSEEVLGALSQLQ